MHSNVMDLRKGPLCRKLGKDHHYFESASAVSTYLTVVDISCVMKTSGGTPVVRRNESCRHVGAAMYWEGRISGAHTASQACAKDCTVVYGDRRGIANAITVLDACAVRALRGRG